MAFQRVLSQQPRTLGRKPTWQFNEYSRSSHSVQEAHRLRVEHIRGNFTPRTFYIYMYTLNPMIHYIYFCVFWCLLFLKPFTIKILDQKRINNWANHIILYPHKFLALGYNNILQIILKQLYKTSSATVQCMWYHVLHCVYSKFNKYMCKRNVGSNPSQEVNSSEDSCCYNGTLQHDFCFSKTTINTSWCIV